MSRFVYAALLISTNATAALAQDAAPHGSLTDLRLNVMLYTLVIFGITYFVLSKYAFGPITAAVAAREKALEDAIEGAKRDRDAAAKLLEDHRLQLDAARGEAQKLIADGRAVAEKMRHDLLEQTHQEQQALLERAQREIANERDKAIGQLRREAIHLAIAGASRVIEENLDSPKNRTLVENYLSSIGSLEVTS
jgi:F-type H+-transporting ATPase subunit b